VIILTEPIRDFSLSAHANISNLRRHTTTNSYHITSKSLFPAIHYFDAV